MDGDNKSTRVSIQKRIKKLKAGERSSPFHWQSMGLPSAYVVATAGWFILTGFPNFSFEFDVTHAATC